MAVSSQARRRNPSPAAATEQTGAARSAGERPRPRATDPRANQRERTRGAVMEAARKLLLEGRVPSIADAAREARVSRATAYRYFPTQGTLIREAVDAVLIRPWEWEERLEGPGGLVERVERVSSEMLGLMRDNEALMRGSLLLALQQWAKIQAGDELAEEPIKRGGRREGIAAALSPYEGTLDGETLHRLAMAISVVLGIEARVVLRDIWNLSEDEARQVTMWMARTLAQAATKQRAKG